MNADIVNQNYNTKEQCPTVLCQEAEKILRDVFIFKNMVKCELQAVLEMCYAVRYESGDVICDESNCDKGLGVVLSGKCIAENRHGNKTVVLNYFSPGDVFGAALLFSRSEDGKYASVVRAVEDCVVMFMGQDQAERLVRTSSCFAINYIEFLSSRIRFLNDKISGFTAGDAENKLLEYIKTLPVREDGSILISLEYTELAKMLGIGRASLYRAFDGLCNRGIIIKNDKQITLISEV